jgi:hypothetical protein
MKDIQVSKLSACLSPMESSLEIQAMIQVAIAAHLLGPCKYKTERRLNLQEEHTVITDLNEDQR